MAQINDLESGFTKTEALAFGKHVVQGHLLQHIVEFVGTEKQFTLLMDLGRGAPDEDGEGEWDGVEAVYYRGFLISSDNWHFHGGKLSSGENDPDQGVDSFFPGGITYSGSSYIAIRLPVGVADEADPSGLDIIVRTSKLQDYDEDGNPLGISYTANPAREKAFLVKRRGQLSRINWAKFVAARDYYGGVLDWAAGGSFQTFTVFNGVPDYDVNGPLSVNTLTGAITKTGGADAYDNYAKTVQRIAAGQDGHFRITLGSAFPTGTGGGCMYLIDSDRQAKFGICWGNGHISILANSVALDDPTVPYDFPAVAGDVIELAVEDDLFVLKQNDVVKTIPQGAAPVPADTDLFGEIYLWEDTASITASTFNGQTVDTSTPTTTEIKRFEVHCAFTDPVNIDAAIDYIDFLCCSDTVERGKPIDFLTPEARASVFTFDEDTNVVGRTVRLYNKRLKERPNRLWGFFRNLLSQYLEEEYTPPETRDELFDKLGYIVDPGLMNLASTNGGQAQRTVKFQMRRQSDDPLHCDLTGMPSSFRVVKGNVVTVLTKKLNRVPKDFLVLRATRENDMTRKFTLQEYHDDDYRDSDQGAQQTGVGTQPPSPFEPPGNPFLTLEQLATDALTLQVRGTVTFPIYAGSLIGRIYVTPDGGSETFTGLTISPIPGTNQATFDYVVPSEGLYTFRVALETSTGVPGGNASADITVVLATLLVDFTTGVILFDSVSGLGLYDSGV